MKKYLRLAVLLIILTFSTSIFAGDYANLNFIGFSKDGKYLAFEEYGIGDGAGFPYSNFYFVSVEKNSFAAAPVKVFIENESATQAQARAKAKTLAAKTMTKLKIVAGNTGTHLVSHLLTDLTLDERAPNTPEIIRFAEFVTSNHRAGDYQLALDSTLTKTKDCETYGFETFKMNLSLINKETNAVSILQKDAELPKARGCVMSYRIQDVFVSGQYLAVFLNINLPGFEGPDMRFLAVTGKKN